TTQIYTLSLHDALPISRLRGAYDVATTENKMSSPMKSDCITIVTPVFNDWRSLSKLVSEIDSLPELAELSFRVLAVETKAPPTRSEEHTSELQSRRDLV